MFVQAVFRNECRLHGFSYLFFIRRLVLSYVELDFPRYQDNLNNLKEQKVKKKINKKLIN